MKSSSQSRKRDKQLPVRVTAEEQLAATALARDAGKTVGELVRGLLFSSPRPGPRPRRRQPTAGVVELARISGLLGKYGSNLNQIARDANSGGEIVRADEVAQLAAEVREIKLLVLKELGYGD